MPESPNRQRKRHRTLGDEWADIEALALLDAPSRQRRESKRMFFRGAFALYRMLIAELDKTPDDVPTGFDLALLCDLGREMQWFFAEMRAGRA